MLSSPFAYNEIPAHHIIKKIATRYVILYILLIHAADFGSFLYNKLTSCIGLGQNINSCHWPKSKWKFVGVYKPQTDIKPANNCISKYHPHKKYLSDHRHILPYQALNSIKWPCTLEFGFDGMYTTYVILVPWRWQGVNYTQSNWRQKGSLQLSSWAMTQWNLKSLINSWC